MRFDILTVFPEYLAALDLSLIGKARDAGLLEVGVRDLREWTTDRHRTVDDTPVGGGAGMVMRPDVWGKALDEHLEGPGVKILAIPTPSGPRLNQELCESLAARADRIVIACGRYEGIDARVAEHYRTREDVEVLEFSLGDYVLNGGEVAALTLVEAVGRLIPGVVGNPESLVEESHGEAGLLEYPVFTRPLDWRGHAVPELLTSGDHGKVARWRRDEALRRTAERRPDMIRALNAHELDKGDRLVLSPYGWLWPRHPEPYSHPVRMRLDDSPDPAEVADLAARTFPDACPAWLPAEAVRAHIATELSPERFDFYGEDKDHQLLGVRAEGGPLLGYSLVILPVASTPPLAELEGAAELSKCYLEGSWRGSGLNAFLLGAALDRAARALGHGRIWLGTNAGNKRAIRAYERHGFELAGRRTYLVGDQPNDDVVMVRELDMAY